MQYACTGDFFYVKPLSFSKSYDKKDCSSHIIEFFPILLFKKLLQAITEVGLIKFTKYPI